MISWIRIVFLLFNKYLSIDMFVDRKYERKINDVYLLSYVTIKQPRLVYIYTNIDVAAKNVCAFAGTRNIFSNQCKRAGVVSWTTKLERSVLFAELTAIFGESCRCWWFVCDVLQIKIVAYILDGCQVVQAKVLVAEKSFITIDNKLC